MGTRACILPMLDEDDDDFQDPIPTFSLSRSLAMPPRSPTARRPLMSSVAAPPRKKLKLPQARGKENRPISVSKKGEASNQGSKAGRNRADSIPRSESAEPSRKLSEKVNVAADEDSTLLSPKESIPGVTESREGDGTPREKGRVINGEISRLPDEFRKDSVPKDRDYPEKSTQADSQSLLGDDGTVSSSGSETRQAESSDLCSWSASNIPIDCLDHEFENETNNNLKNQDLCIANSDSHLSCNADLKLTLPSGGFYTSSIESRLVQYRAGCRSSTIEGCPEDNQDGEFEAGTQLKELMNLCAMVDDINGPVVDDCHSFEEAFLFPTENAVSEHQSSALVECPLCGANITNLSEEYRHVHTNECLDKDVFPKVNGSSDGSNQQMMPKDDASRVCDFLASLDLSRYAELFLKEEVDWDTLLWLSEEDLLGIGIAALGPRKKIVRALCQLRQGNNQVVKRTEAAPNEVNGENVRVQPGNKLITEFFQNPSRGGHNVNLSGNAPAAAERERINGSVSNRKAVRKQVQTSRLRDIPAWCCIPGTQFRVDAFRFLRADCSHWFLTHFHMDHYQGLTKNFRHGKIYCSAITANLVNSKFGISWDRLHVLPIGQKIHIDGVGVTCFDANHCPGAVIILFEPPNGKVVLHTGDFRFCEAMANSSILQQCHVHTLILDTTYCDPQYDFPKQEAVIQFVIDAIQAEAFNPRTLFLIGSYTIGKERVFLEVARFLKRKIFVGAAKLRLLQCLGLPEEDMQWFTLNETESQVHIVPMWTIASFKRMKQISNQYSARYNLIVAFSPTGWTFGKGRKKSPGRRWQQGTIIRYEVPYSEHSSFSELKEFVQFISPEVVIPSVNNTGPESVESMVSLLTPS